MINSRKMIKQEAKVKMVGNWGITIALILVQFLLLMPIEIIFQGVDITNFSMYAMYLIASIVIGAGLDVMTTDFFIDISREGKAEIGKSINTVFKLFGKGLLITLLISLIVGLGTFLFIIPGIIFGIKYMFAIYVLIDNPDIGIMDALKRSSEITNGYKMDLFIFQLSFTLWIFLIPLTLGLGMFYVIPYMASATAIYYNELANN